MNDGYVGTMDRELAAWVEALDDDPLVGRVIRGSASCDEYVRFLRSTYHYLRWSGPLLARTAAGLRRAGRYPWLADLAERKASEESPHHAWVLSDLQACGVDDGVVVRTPAPSAVRAYVEWATAMADDGSPAYLGAAYALEVLSMRRAGTAAESLRRRGAIPNVALAVSFLAGHADADAGHVAALREVLERIDDPRDRSAIALSAAVLRELYRRFFHDPPPARSLRERSAACEESAA